MPQTHAIRLVRGTYVVRRFARLRKGLRVPAGRDLVVGPGATVAGSVRGGGSVHLGRGACVEGAVVTAWDVVLGAHAVVHGSIECQGHVTLQAGARVGGDVRCGGRARLVGAIVEGVVRSLDDVEVAPGSVVGGLEAGGRIRALGGPGPIGLSGGPDIERRMRPLTGQDPSPRRPPMPPSPIPGPEPDDDGDDDDDVDPDD